MNNKINTTKIKKHLSKLLIFSVLGFISLSLLIIAPSSVSADETGSSLNVANDEFFDSVNPFITEGVDQNIASTLSTPGGIVSRLLQFLFPLAGLVLFIMLIWGGFEILAKSSQGSKGLEAGKNRITAAIIGFLLLFATYWMAQIIEIVFGIVIV